MLCSWNRLERNMASGRRAWLPLGVSRTFEGADHGHRAKVWCPIVPEDAAHAGPFYDNPYVLAMWPCCEASTLFSQPHAGQHGGHPRFKHATNTMSWNLMGPCCYACAPVVYCCYAGMWAISGCYCGNELPCTEKKVTALFAENYPDLVTSKTSVSRAPHAASMDRPRDPAPPEPVVVATAVQPDEDKTKAQLIKFREMLDEGLITQDDYDRKKEGLLFNAVV